MNESLTKNHSGLGSLFVESVTLRFAKKQPEARGFGHTMDGPRYAVVLERVWLERSKRAMSIGLCSEGVSRVDNICLQRIIGRVGGVTFGHDACNDRMHGSRRSVAYGVNTAVSTRNELNELTRYGYGKQCLPSRNVPMA